MFIAMNRFQVKIGSEAAPVRTAASRQNQGISLGGVGLVA